MNNAPKPDQRILDFYRCRAEYLAPYWRGDHWEPPGWSVYVRWPWRPEDYYWFPQIESFFEAVRSLERSVRQECRRQRKREIRQLGRPGESYDIPVEGLRWAIWPEQEKIGFLKTGFQQTVLERRKAVWRYFCPVNRRGRAPARPELSI